MKVNFELLGSVTFAFVGGYKGMAVCSEHDEWNPAMGAAVALLKARPKYNKAMRDYINDLNKLFPQHDYSSKVFLKLIKIKKIKLTSAEAMHYCMIRSELSNRIRVASKLVNKSEWDDERGWDFPRRRRGPDNALIIEDCAKKLLAACPSLRGLSA